MTDHEAGNQEGNHSQITRRKLNKYEQDYQGQIKRTTSQHHIKYTASSKIINNDILRYHTKIYVEFSEELSKFSAKCNAKDFKISE